MSRTKEFFMNFRARFFNTEMEDLVRQMEAEEKEWYMSQEKPYLKYGEDDYDSSVTEQGF